MGPCLRKVSRQSQSGLDQKTGRGDVMELLRFSAILVAGIGLGFSLIPHSNAETRLAKIQCSRGGIVPQMVCSNSSFESEVISVPTMSDFDGLQTKVNDLEAKLEDLAKNLRSDIDVREGETRTAFEE